MLNWNALAIALHCLILATKSGDPLAIKQLVPVASKVSRSWE